MLRDLTNQRFGKLTVLYRTSDYVSPGGFKSVRWHCVCDCGKEVDVVAKCLTLGETKSCGCSKKGKFNDYEVCGDVAKIKCKKGTVLIDVEDIPKVNFTRWYITMQGYALSSDNKNLIHRVIMNCPKGMVVDHINHNTLDNRKTNLRICTQRQNTMNRKPMATTGEFGISMIQGKYYCVQIDGKYIGITKNLQDAVKLRNEALAGTDQLRYNSYLSYLGD